MASSGNYGRWIAIAILLPLCAWLVYRNLLAPADPRLAAPAPPAVSPRSAAVAPQDSSAQTAAPPPQRARRGGNGEPLTQQELASLDPTLREDLLERSRKIAYKGSTRNIFQYYTPPPPPAPPAPPAPPIGPRAPSAAATTAPRPVATPSSPPIALKFYGIAVPPGSSDKKAFLTNGDEIIIAKEGETIARFYKVIRIGVNSIELQDNRTERHQSLPLLEE